MLYNQWGEYFCEKSNPDVIVRNKQLAARRRSVKAREQNNNMNLCVNIQVLRFDKSNTYEEEDAKEQK